MPGNLLQNATQMMAAWCVTALLLASAAHGTQRQESSHVDEVVKMLTKLELKCDREMHNEKLAYYKYETFCKTSLFDANSSFKNAAIEVKTLSAQLEKNAAEAEELEDGIQELRASIELWENETVTAQKIRKKEAKDAQNSFKEYKETVKVIQRTLKVLQETRTAVKDAAAVDQANESSLLAMPADLKSSIYSLLQSKAFDPYGEDNVGVSFQSSGAVKMLEDLKRKTQDEHIKAEQEEQGAKRSHALLMKRLEINIKQAKGSIAEKSSAKEVRRKKMAGIKLDLQVSKDAKLESNAKIQTTRSDCMEKSVEYDKNQATREEELKALGIAKQILGSDGLSEKEEKHITVLLQLRSSHATSLSQHFRGSQPREIQGRLAEHLRRSAEKTGSQRLSMLAKYAQAMNPDNTMDRLAGIVQEVLYKLQAELQNLQNQKNLCDKEMSTNNYTRQTKTASVEDLRATVEQNEAEIKALAYQLKDLRESLNATKKEVSDATEFRASEAAKHSETVKDAQDSQLQVTRAKEVLSNFYAASQGSFIQQSSDMEAAMEQAAQAPYQGQSSSSSIVAMLEVIISDFAKLEAETTEDEETAQQMFKRFSVESKKEIAVTEKEISIKERKTEELKLENAHSRRELKLTKDELQAALDYYEHLKPMCENTAPSYEERKAQRDNEIEALKGALTLIGV